MDSAMLTFAFLFGLGILLAPTIVFTALTVILFNKGEQKRIEENLIGEPSSFARAIMYGNIVIASILIIFNIIILMYSESLSWDVVSDGWSFTVLWTLLAWIPLLISLIKLKDKGLKYRKWFIISWILNFLVFFTGMMNPIPQSV